MARIYLDARAASAAMSGISRYCGGLIPELVAQGAEHEIIVIRSERASETQLVPAGHVREVAIPGSTGATALLMSGSQLTRLFRRFGPADLYHSLFHVLPWGIRRGRLAPRRIIVTLHDLIWIDYARQVERTALAAAWRRQLGSVAIPYALRNADHVICDSAATARSAERWVPQERCTVIHLGLGREFLEARETVMTGLARRLEAPYITAFGVPKAYKNIRCLVSAFAILRRTWPSVRLLLIGGDGGVRRDFERSGVADSITILHPTTDHELRDIIEQAEVLVVPSLVEGFGLPVIEAMALGTPVIVSHAPALREVAADAALAFDPASATELAEVLARLLGDKSLRIEMVRRGRLRSRLFTWTRAATDTLAIYDRVLRHEHIVPLLARSRA